MHAAHRYRNSGAYLLYIGTVLIRERHSAPLPTTTVGPGVLKTQLTATALGSCPSQPSHLKASKLSSKPDPYLIPSALLC
jgi:hypothetical protein